MSYLAEVGTVTGTSKTSNGLGGLADTLREGDLVDTLGLLGGDNNTTAGGSGSNVNGLIK